MNLFTKNLVFNQCLKRSPNLFCLPNQLRLGCAHYSSPLNNSPNFQSELLGRADLKERKIYFLPERNLVSSYFRELVKVKVSNAFDSVRFLGKGEERLLGFKWYSTLDEVDHKEFMKLLDMPDTLYSWFKIIELHTWMLLLNLPQVTRSHRVVRIGVINAMWLDTERRSEILAPANKNFKKNMRALYQRFQVSLYLYDDAYFNNDREFCCALWYNFFDKENVDPRLMEVLVSYIRYQVQYLNDVKLPLNDVEDKNLKVWTPLSTHYEAVFNLS